MKGILGRKNSFLHQYSPASLRDVSASIFQTAPVDESGMIKKQMRAHNK
jgi:hypothetical protein